MSLSKPKQAPRRRPKTRHKVPLPKIKRPPRRRYLKTRHKERNLLLNGWRNLSGFGTGLVSRLPGVIPTQNALKSEVIDYTYSGNRRDFNVCIHQKDYLGTPGLHHPRSVTLYKDVTIGWPSELPWYRWYTQDPVLLNRPVLETAFVPTLPTLNQVDNGCVTEEFEAFMKLRAVCVDRYMNLLQSAYELKDVPETSRGLLGLAKFLGSSGAARRLKPGATALEAAKAYLTYQFGIAPTVSDVKKFIEKVSREKIVALQVPTRIRKGEVLRAHWRIRKSDPALTQLCGFPVMAELQRSSWFGTNGVYTRPNTAELTTPWCPTDKLRTVRCYEYSGMVFGRLKRDIEFSATQRQTKTWAWNCPIAATLWAVTPLSFLVDWFIDIGSVIERLDHFVMPIGVLPEFETGVWHSVRREAIVRQPSVICRTAISQLNRVSNSPVWEYTVNSTAFVNQWNHTERSSMFSREVYTPGFDVWLPPLRWKLSAYQLSTGTALAMNLLNGVKKFLSKH